MSFLRMSRKIVGAGKPATVRDQPHAQRGEAILINWLNETTVARSCVLLLEDESQ
jgi:hypothetical protein